MPDYHLYIGTMEEAIQDLIKQAEQIYTEGVEQTRKLKESMDKVDNFLSGVPEERIAMVNYLNKTFETCSWGTVLSSFDLTEDVIKEIIDLAKIMQRHKTYSIPGACFIVMLTNPNSHDYQIGKPYKTDGSSIKPSVCAFGSEGFYGNNFPSTRGSVRAATDEEIAAWVVGWLLNEVKALPPLQRPKDAVLTNYLEILNATLKGK